MFLLTFGLIVQLQTVTSNLAIASRGLQTLYGHFPYAQAASYHLSQIRGYYRSVERLHFETAKAYNLMVQAATQEGISLVALSGFRDYSTQAQLFQAQTLRRGSQKAAARISAPPGYSEHHTGYAIDIGDANAPQTHLEITFEYTAAFRWLKQNASKFGFEMSFPLQNAQGISYEPWHWRFANSPEAAEIFARARSWRN